VERVETVVVGSGQAGLATSYFLTQHGREHVVLERARVGETWRTERWDGFFLNTPDSAQRLPVFEYSGDDPDAFAPLADVIELLEGYGVVTKYGNCRCLIEDWGVVDEAAIGERFRALAPELDERRRRLWAAAEARAAGRGGIAATARATGTAMDTIR
jgi:phytoene dehydrogenase-like protein